MINTSHVNLLNLIHTPMKKVASTGGGEYAGACPLCGGKDRFRAWPHADPPRWWCRQCGQSGDAIALEQLLSGSSFVEACETLGVDREKPKPPAEKPRSIPALDNPHWQERAASFVEWAWCNLQSGDYPDVNRYLEDRGINEVWSDLWRLGYNPQDWRMEWGGVDVFLPEGIVIPYLDAFEGLPRKINIRRPQNAHPKYLQVRGGANWLYNAFSLKAGCIAVLVEGELDAISVKVGFHHHKIIPVATGSTTGARWLRWPALLSIAHRVLVAFDADDAGESAAKWWGQYLSNARRLIPESHDVNDMLVQGHSLQHWIEKGLAQ